MEKENAIRLTYSQKHLYSDFSVWLLVVANILIIFFAIKGNWNVLTIMWVYWFQSAIIGFFEFIKILTVRDFLKKPGTGAKILTALGFGFPYAFFHFAIAVVLLIFSFFEYIRDIPFLIFNAKHIILGAGIFFINHLFSFFYNRNKVEKQQSIVKVMFLPYLRVLPMHLTIIVLGSIFIHAIAGAVAQVVPVATQPILIVFLSFKAIVDVVMHIIEHKNFKRITN